jgi:hypothetical protein
VLVPKSNADTQKRNGSLANPDITIWIQIEVAGTRG